MLPILPRSAFGSVADSHLSPALLSPPQVFGIRIMQTLMPFMRRLRRMTDLIIWVRRLAQRQPHRS